MKDIKITNQRRDEFETSIVKEQRIRTEREGNSNDYKEKINTYLNHFDDRLKALENLWREQQSQMSECFIQINEVDKTSQNRDINIDENVLYLNY